MMTYKSKTIEELKKKYEYKIDPLNLTDTAYIIYCIFYGRFVITLENYEFNEKINEIQQIIYNKQDKIDKNKLESFEKTLKEISDGCEKILKNVDFDYFEIRPVIGGISLDYKRNKDIPGAADIYQKIGKEIIDKEVNNFIRYEKILMSYNEQIISIKKNLTN